MSRKKISRSKIRELHGEGKSDSEIAGEVECHPNTVRKIRERELGLKSNNPREKPINRDKLWEDYMNNMSIGELAEKYGYKSMSALKRAIGRIWRESKNE